MKSKIGIITLFLLATGGLTTAFVASAEKGKNSKKVLDESSHHILLAISHGHCNLGLTGELEELNVEYSADDMRSMRVDFALNTETLQAGHEEKNGPITQGVRAEGMFKGDGKHYLRFETEDVFMLGENWFQLRGKITFKGISQITRLRVTPIQDENGKRKFVLDGMIDLKQFEMDLNTDNSDPTDIEHGRYMFVNLVISEKPNC